VETIDDRLQIHTTEPTAPKGKQVISYSRKSTKQNPVADADKFRAVVADTFPTLRIYNVEGSDDVQPQDVFKAALDKVIAEAAGDVLQNFVLANPAATEIPADLLTFSAVVAQMQDDQTSGRLNGDSIAAWYDSTTMTAEATTRYNGDAAKAGTLRSKYVSLASNNAGINPDLAAKMLTYLEKQDTSSTVAKAVTARLARLMQVKSTGDDL
jgi:hypothetical protein